MAFRKLNELTTDNFNSFQSMDFLEMVEDYIDDQILQENMRKPSAAIAPSSIRCARHNWFRLRGTEPDKPKYVDASLSFKATLGSVIHDIIQHQLKDMLNHNWIPVDKYLLDHPIADRYIINSPSSDTSLETRIEFLDIPIRFACDGIIRLNEQYYLLEIKTCESAAFKKLNDIRKKDIDQIKCYATLLGVSNVLVLYVDRTYGDRKCYQLKVNDYEMIDIRNNLNKIVILSKSNIAPDPLPSGDFMCTSSYCKYYKKCKEWGR